MKLYLYLKHFPPADDSFNEGTSKAVHGFAAGLVLCGAEVTVLCEGLKRSSFLSPKGYQIECFPNKKYKHPSFQLGLGLDKYIEKCTKNSLFILNGIFHRSVCSISRVLKKYRLPYIISPHDPYHPSIFQKNSWLKWPYWFFLEKPMLNHAMAVQVLDPRHGDLLHQLGITSPTIALPNGFDSQHICPGSALSWNLHETPRLFFLGRMDAHNKGLDILLDAFAEVSRQKNIHLTLQGEDRGSKKQLEEQARMLDIADKVSFLDPDYSQSSAGLIAKYDVFCIASRFEGFSLSALEAMVAGRVLLVSEVAGIAAHVKASGCGVVVKPEQSCLVEGLLELLEKRTNWQEMGLKGREYVLHSLNWPEIAFDALKEYRSLMRQHVPFSFIEADAKVAS